jgi:branched-chain amino acid transport system substrate-binding protein
MDNILIGVLVQALISVSQCHRVFVSVRTGFVVMCCALTFSCGQQDDSVDWSGPARLALVVPQTGALKSEGQMLQLGALTAMYEARGQADQRTVKMVVYDSPCNAEGAAVVARRLAGDPSVCAVVGYLCAEAVGAALPIYEEEDLALINPTLSADYVRTLDSRHLFPLLYGDGEQAAFLAAYVKQGLGLTKVAVLSDGSGYGELLKASFIAEAEQQELELVAKVAVTPDVTEVARAVKLLKSVSPEAIFLAAKTNAASLFLLERQSQQLAGRVLGPDRLADIDLYEMVGQAADGLLVCQPILFGTKDSEKVGFVRKFEMLHKRQPDWIAAAGYDAMRLALEVLQRSGPKRAAFLQVLREISGPDSSFRGLSGSVFFRKDGTSQRPFFVAAVHGGELRAAKPSSVEFP